MITDPELDGAWEAEHAGERAEELAPRGRAEGAAGARRPWLWALGGAVAASAVWAGGLYAFGDRLAEPEVRYAVTDDLCGRFKAPALAAALGAFTDSTPRKAGRQPALDWASCSRSGDSKDGSGGFMVVAMVELHKKSDPAPEFALGSQSDRMFDSDLRWEEVPGLGEQALVGSSDGSSDLRLRVRDGGAVFTFVAMFFNRTEGEPGLPVKEAAPPDQDALTAAAVEDARALMAALRKD